MAFIVREPTRKVHITRILGTNRAGEILPDIWLDVERFEQYAKVSQAQKTITKFRWHDDPDDAEEYRPEDDDGTARNTVVLKVCSPDEEDLNDPEEWVPVRVIRKVYLQGGDDQGSATNQKYLTETLTAERNVETRRIFHYDTSIDTKAEAAFDDPERKAYVAKSADYQKDDATKDDSQYVEFEIVTSINKHTSAHEQSNGTDQQVIQKFKNQYLIDETEPARFEELGNEDKNPPYRLDPFQNIVNVNWGGVEQQWLLGNSDTFEPNPSDPFIPWASIDEDDEVRSGTVGASGLGYTVFVEQGFVAFGTVTVVVDGNEVKRKTFMAGTYAGEVYSGTIVDGELQWQMVTSFSDGIASVSHANERFFVSYFLADDKAATRFAITEDGATFTTGINPSPGIDDGLWGNVVYDPETELYVTIGSHETENDDLADMNFVWATSIDGLSWSYGSDGSDPYSGTGGQYDVQQSTVAFGNEVFVAAASRKHRYAQFPDFPDVAPDFVMHECAVATSVNGSSWTLRSLPGTTVYGSEDVTGGFSGDGNTGGDTYAVVFIKDKNNNPELNGYFMAAGVEYSNRGDHSRIQGMLWKSEDGVSWSLIRSEGGPDGNSPPETPAGVGPLNSYYSSLSAINTTRKLGKISTGP